MNNAERFYLSGISSNVAVTCVTITGSLSFRSRAGLQSTTSSALGAHLGSVRNSACTTELKLSATLDKSIIGDIVIDQLPCPQAKVYNMRGSPATFTLPTNTTSRDRLAWQMRPVLGAISSLFLLSRRSEREVGGIVDGVLG